MKKVVAGEGEGAQRPVDALRLHRLCEGDGMSKKPLAQVLRCKDPKHIDFAVGSTFVCPTCKGAGIDLGPVALLVKAIDNYYYQRYGHAPGQVGRAALELDAALAPFDTAQARPITEAMDKLREVAGPYYDGIVLCDGCNVNWPHEHRCNSIGGGGRIMVRGDVISGVCQCEECAPFVRRYGHKGDHL